MSAGSRRRFFGPTASASMSSGLILAASSGAEGGPSTPLARRPLPRFNRRQELGGEDERGRATERGLRGGRSRLRRLRGGGAAVGGSIGPRRAARGRRARPQPLAARADRLRQDHVPPDPVLEPDDRA